MSNSQAKAGALIPEAVRLERVRRAKGFSDSLWNFWKRLCSQAPAETEAPPAGPVKPPATWGTWVDEGGNYKVSYEAARNYHSDRHAPGHYYAQVAAVFEVRLEWLLTGRGGMTEGEDSLLRAGIERDAEGFIVSMEWTEEQRRTSRISQLFDKAPRTVGVSWPVLPHEAADVARSFVTEWLFRVGSSSASLALTGGESREPTVHDVARFYDRTFAEPLRPLESAPHEQQLGAFHTHMALLHLRGIPIPDPLEADTASPSRHED